MAQPEQQLGLPEAARRIGAPYLRVWHAVVRGEVRAVRDGWSYLVRESDLKVLAAAVGAPWPAEPPEPKPRRRAA